MHLGRSSYFIRLFGCPVKCPWCDSAETWHPDFKPKSVPRMSVEELATLANAAQPEFVVITGGEPAIHRLEPLVDAFHGVGLPVHIETSGTFAIPESIDWVTVSPKVYRDPLPELIERADELKLIVENPDSIKYWEDKLGDGLLRADRPVWLHPEWSLRGELKTLKLIADTVSGRGAPFRAGWQLHKLYQVR
ncbi:MAG: 7-carboxy-7-deazaguanine synthase QueE [Verrucomicrobiota bacterium]